MFLLSTLWCASTAWAGDYRLTAAPGKPIDLAPYVDVYDDMSGRLRLSDVLSMTRSTPVIFQSASSHPQPQPTQATRWLRVTIHNDSGSAQPLALIPASANTDEVEVNMELGGAWTQTRFGSSVPLNEHTHAGDRGGNHFVLPPDARVRFYISVRNALPDTVMPILESAERHARVKSSTLAWDAALIGGLAALAWSAILIGSITQRLPYIYLGVLAATEALYEAAIRGQAQIMFWPHAIGWGSRAELMLGSVSLMLFVLFLRSVARRDPLLAGGLLAVDMVLALLGGLLVASWTTDLYTVSVLLTAIGAVIGISLLAVLPFLPRRTLPTVRLLGTAAALLLCHTVLHTANLRDLQATLTRYPAFGMNAVSALLLLALGSTLAMLAAWANRLPRRVRDTATTRPHERAKLRVQVQMHTAALDQALRQATEKSRQQDQLLGYISHDLRAPLATIANYMRLVRAAATPEQQSHLDVIERSLGHQFQLVDEVLTFARGQSQPLELVPAHASPTQLLSEVIGHAVAFCAPKRNAFHFLPPASLPVSVLIDAGRLRQVLLNLLDNAAKFTQDGRVSLCVTSLRRDDHWILEFMVADNGPGVPLERQTEIFSAFQQLRSEHGGVGLGLFIADNIVRSMGSQLTLTSVPGDGARFSFRIEVPGVDQTLVSMSPISVAPPPRFLQVALTLPPLAARQALARLAHDGEVSELRDWLARTRTIHPECEAFLKRVETALAELDLTTIEHLAAASYDAPPANAVTSTPAPLLAAAATVPVPPARRKRTRG
ncbi:ATP-binding protein [Bordetella sp. N]|uniref:sensor histidine kinase n=1 Tax=Bordetella sp. N TaxID=1746199 RepID=UPI0018D22114|nr:ATP-binding protein [Bordetella sp. N]